MTLHGDMTPLITSYNISATSLQNISASCKWRDPQHAERNFSPL